MLYDCIEKCYRFINYFVDCFFFCFLVMVDEDFLVLEFLEDIFLLSMVFISVCDSLFFGLDDLVDIVSSMGIF